MKTNLNFEHTTCKDNLRNETHIKNLLYSKFTIYTIILILIYLLALVSFYKSSFFNFGMFSFFISAFCWIVFYGNSQQTINKNQFKQFSILGLLVVFFNALLLIITKSNFLDFIITIFPLFYIVYFRVLLFLFYKDFVDYFKKPTILFASKGGKWTHENSDPAYIPSNKETIFSNLLFFGPFLFAILVFLLVINN